MRRFLVFILGCSAFIGHAPLAPADELFPYVATTVAESTDVRSGPGEEFYVADQLPADTEVEVYRHDNSSWAAVRPPDGSFSWIPADAVVRSEATNIGRVVRNGAKTRVGSIFGDQHQATYLSLKKGELVEILERRKLRNAAGTSLEEHYRIMPLSGEFRWIAVDDLRPQGLSRGVEAAPPKNIEEQGLVFSDDSDSPSNEFIAQADHPNPQSLSIDEGSMNHLGQPLDSPRWTSVEKDLDGETTRVDNEELDFSEADPATAASTHQSVESGANLPAPSAVEPLTIEVTSPRPRRIDEPLISEEALLHELARVELKLSGTIVKDASRWDLQGLSNQVRAVIDTGELGHVRETGQRLLAKISQFEDIQRRTARLKRTSIASSDHSVSRSLESLTDTEPEDLELRALIGQLKQGFANSPSKYDGEGWLRRVVSNRQGVPAYALTDRNGNIIQFVSPQAGLNLGRYERKRIGIYGVRGFIPEYDRPHLVAQRIISLDRVAR